jgi:hypothetical protein
MESNLVLNLAVKLACGESHLLIWLQQFLAEASWWISG